MKIEKTPLLPSALIALCLSMLAINTQASPNTKQELATGSVVALSIENIAASVDARIMSMKMLANTVANDTHIHHWINEGFADKDESVLINKLGYLVREYGLTSASFADTSSNKYWNHEGFLRVLTPEIDTWYFAYIKAEQQDLISVYHDKNNNRVDLYVNYRQLEGAGLSGIATSFNGVVNMLRQSSLGKKGEVFIVDNDGKIQVHSNPEISGQVDLQTLYSKEAAELLLMPQQFNAFSDSDKPNTSLVSSYIPSMNWFVIAEIKHVD
jgi:methyl-accepting chemotaxis protein